MWRRVLITGAGGQLGRALVTELSPGLEVLPTSRQAVSGGQVACDITDWEQVKETVSGFKPDVILNAAAFTDVDGNEREPEKSRQVNTRGVEHLLTAGEAVGAHMVQFSTDYVFDGQTGPYLEGDQPAPLNAYGRSKLEAEGLVLAGNHHLVIRANVLFGPDIASKASFVRWVVESLRQGQTIRVVDDQINNPTLTVHLAEAIRRALEQEASGLYHYGGLEFASRYDFAKEIARHFKLSLKLIKPIATSDLTQPAPRPLRGGLICSKMKMELNVTNATIGEALSRAFPRA